MATKVKAQIDTHEYTNVLDKPGYTWGMVWVRSSYKVRGARKPASKDGDMYCANLPYVLGYGKEGYVYEGFSSFVECKAAMLDWAHKQ